jgi:hypothetical protein
MKDPSEISSLAEPGQRSGKIWFIHSDGKEHSFYTCINSLTGSRLSAFDSEHPSIDDSVKWIRSVFRDIRKKATVIRFIGDF